MTAGEHLSRLTEEQIRETVAKLKDIEKKASAVLDDAVKERNTFNTRVFKEIERRKKLIKDETDREIKNIRDQADETVRERAAEIQRECEEKKKVIADDFAANGEVWRKTVFDNVLAGI